VIFLVLYCLLLLLSIFSASWRISIAALGLQAVGMGSYFVAAQHDINWHHTVVLAELFIVRGIGVPWVLTHRFRRAKVPRFIDLIPANLLHWTVAAFYVAFAYLAARELASDDYRNTMLVGAAFSAIALGMLALSSQNEIPGQLISVLTIENGMTLFVIGSNQEIPWVLELFVLFDFLVLVVLASNFLRRLKVAAKTEIEIEASRLVQPVPEAKGSAMTSSDYGDVL